MISYYSRDKDCGFPARRIRGEYETLGERERTFSFRTQDYRYKMNFKSEEKEELFIVGDRDRERGVCESYNYKRSNTPVRSQTVKGIR